MSIVVVLQHVRQEMIKMSSPPNVCVEIVVWFVEPGCRAVTVRHRLPEVDENHQYIP